jgi:hypothetical protein
MSKKKRQPTVKEILEAYQAEIKVDVDAEFARLLGVKRQSLFAWKNDEYQPQLNWLRILAFLEPDNWRGRMAVDLLDAMGFGDQAPTVVRNPKYREADEVGS